ncbi:hypothetical protein [Geoalkalibacter halelectricus]|uniref:Uncharacterized protein n=1 Tax=Geoalkalibacter halelectricus TaxID=2847045 RepID=A0ABY5ZJB0_9BACT|nr:hypothetical protein [Geoalkalibacter halelectricus]MDO3379779.1 hypothetical protein [Geoalkalibacter halelectricus]UWZ79213.1 hypothetical protein L9S41_16245 [Geoalkalibacter halelectricus]
MKRKFLLMCALGLFFLASAAWADDFWVGTLSGGGESVENAFNFDWASSGSGVAENVGPVAGPLELGDIITFRFQSFLTHVNDPNGQPLILDGLGSHYEFTVVAQIDEVVVDLVELGSSTVATFETLPGGLFYIYYDENNNAKVSEGSGFDDGIVVAYGVIMGGQESVFSFNSDTSIGLGASVIYGDVTWVNSEFFDPSSNIVGWRFEGTQHYPPLESNTSAFFISSPGEGNFEEYVVQETDLVLKVDGSSKFVVEEVEAGACRVTGGGHSTSGEAPDGEWDETFAEVKATGNPNWYNTYQFGGQAGANTAMQPQPKGQWTHHQQRGPDGSFIFHAGTASAPPGTEITMIECSDPGNCLPARPAEFKQIDFNGVGTFRNIRNAPPSLAHVVPGETYHYFEVHIEDLGEPGRSGKQPDADDILCPPEGSPGEIANCECPDFYRITIYQGVIPEFDPATGKVTNLNTEDVVYDVYGYLTGGNLQIHPPTGFDMQ